MRLRSTGFRRGVESIPTAPRLNALRPAAFWPVVLCCCCAAIALADTHPRLLIRAAELPRLRHACGVGQSGTGETGWGKFGQRAADFQAVRGYFAEHVPGEPLPGELIAAAFLHLADPGGPSDQVALETVNAALTATSRVTTDTLELVIALDWCWADLDPQARRDFVLSVRGEAAPLQPEDSPLNAGAFREKLTALALALAVDETDDPNPSWAVLRNRLLEDAHTHCRATLPTFVAWRGLSPTGPTAAAAEECETALAIELAGMLDGQPLWPEYRESVGRWMEHYLYAGSDHPALQHGFLHDDGTAAPLTPVPAWRELWALTAQLIAARTGDPAAVTVAEQVQFKAQQSTEMLAKLWRWVPIVLPADGRAGCDVAKLPLARNFGSAVVFRGGEGPEATRVWIDAAQPFLRRRQHFDAGHFLVSRGGHLAVDGGDDITLEAVPSKGGRQRLGQASDAFDFEQYLTATIAHNCVVCWDAARLYHWYGARYVPTGGQRPIEGTCTDFATQLAVQGRVTGRQVAYGQDDDGAYLALDLTAAYDPRSVAGYSREFVFFWKRALVVVDRVTLTSSRMAPTWVLNLPARPQVDGHGLAPEARVAGSTNDGGVWRYTDASWLRWTDRDGSLWLAMPSPARKQWQVVGGPATQELVPAGPSKGRSYAGGEADGFERLVIPAARHGALNAWYRLGTPTLLGPEFGKVPHWGRVEVEPAERDTSIMFVAVLVTGRADAEDGPVARSTRDADTLTLVLRDGEDAGVLRIPTGTARGGTLTVSDKATEAWTLPTGLQADPPLPEQAVTELPAAR